MIQEIHVWILILKFCYWWTDFINKMKNNDNFYVNNCRNFFYKVYYHKNVKSAYLKYLMSTLLVFPLILLQASAPSPYVINVTPSYRIRQEYREQLRYRPYYNVVSRHQFYLPSPYVYMFKMWMLHVLQGPIKWMIVILFLPIPFGYETFESFDIQIYLVKK